ncbi:hypothetical protein FRE64_11555 [Euhalothece natronophila Z-M001]|uniref:SbsA Ig-like domain-containing protein n=1 Tax=Euhalothece natronophila Z-M001 TaxID=522448 RepID=A0A5B8NML8_9CHRO|nr:hypothetical protein [Euhalothece natronophila]QDZ40532.1 hypothetical protein FRE64_11555 [Euhalothece natronophila Z-M001]
MATKSHFSPIDRVAVIVIILLGIFVTFLVTADNVCGTDCWFKVSPSVQQFNWEEREINANDRAFILTFSRPMDRASVEENLEIEPDLSGKISWSGRRMAYTLDEPAPYGREYQIKIEGAKERLGSEIRPFDEIVRTRDRAFAYLGVEGDEKGRLIVYNLTQQEKSILTPPDLVVHEFESYPERDRILFTATDQETWEEGKIDQQLYTVTTGLNQNQSDKEVKRILDNQDYRLLDFDLSPNGEKIVVRRAEKENLGDVSLWLLENNQAPKMLEETTGGQFMIPPDSETLAIAQDQGVGLIPLTDDTEPSNFLPRYGQVISFSPDGKAAAMVNFNTQDAEKQYIRSLYFVNNRGVEKNLLDTDGSILSCEFSPRGTHLYCLLTELMEGEDYQEQPYLVSIDLETEDVTPMMTLPEYQDIEMSLSPDGLALLFDQIITVNNPENRSSTLRSDSGETIIGSSLWLLIPGSPLTASSHDHSQLEELPIAGLGPKWLP